MDFDVKFDDLHKIVDFVEKASKADYDIDILQGHYILNAKSLMALLSLNFNEKITVRTHAYEDKSLEFLNSVHKHITKDSKNLLKKGYKDGIVR